MVLQTICLCILKDQNMVHQGNPLVQNEDNKDKDLDIFGGCQAT